MNAAPVLTTERLTLRRPDAGDAEGFIAFQASDRAAMAGGVKDRWDAWRAFAAILGHWAIRGFGLFAATETATGRTVGLIGHWFPEGWPEREIGWTLWSAADEGRGFAAEAARAARDDAFGRLGWDTAVSYIAHGNDRSVALARRLGCVADASAATPKGLPCHVFRHPLPGSGAA